MRRNIYTDNNKMTFINPKWENTQNIISIKKIKHLAKAYVEDRQNSPWFAELCKRLHTTCTSHQMIPCDNSRSLMALRGGGADSV